jgi:hypothetical protein
MTVPSYVETMRVVAVYADPRSGKRIYVGQAPS